jgi:uncharacterized membrane protein
MTTSSREAHSRSLAKAVSWRITGSIDTFVLSFIITGSFKFASSIAVTEMVTKIVLYYLHERAWNFVPWGKTRRARWFGRAGPGVAEEARPAA